MINKEMNDNKSEKKESKEVKPNEDSGIYFSSSLKISDPDMAFGNGGASVDETGVITYLPPNTSGQNAALYNQTYAKIVDDTSVFNLDPTRNKMTVFHTTGRVYTDILVQCLTIYLMS